MRCHLPSSLDTEVSRDVGLWGTRHCLLASHPGLLMASDQVRSSWTGRHELPRPDNPRDSVSSEEGKWHLMVPQSRTPVPDAGGPCLMSDYYGRLTPYSSCRLRISVMSESACGDDGCKGEQAICVARIRRIAFVLVEGETNGNCSFD